LAMAAGIATLKELKKPGLYDQVNALGSRMVQGLRSAVEAGKIPAQVNSFGSLATIFFAERPVRNYHDAKRSNTKRYARYFREMLDLGIFLAPSQFEATFVSAVHTEKDIARAIEAARQVFVMLASEPNP